MCWHSEGSVACGSENIGNHMALANLLHCKRPYYLRSVVVLRLMTYAQSFFFCFKLNSLMSVRKYNVSNRSFILRNRLILHVCKYHLSNYANKDRLQSCLQPFVENSFLNCFSWCICWPLGSDLFLPYFVGSCKRPVVCLLAVQLFDHLKLIEAWLWPSSSSGVSTPHPILHSTLL